MEDRTLAALLEDAVADVEPVDRLGAIRSRVAPSRRSWWYAGGAVVAAAATVATVAGLGGGPLERAVDPATPAGTSSATPTTDVTAGLNKLYWVGSTPQGPRLFAEPTRVNAGYGESQLHAALNALLRGAPTDSDYVTHWPSARLQSVREAADRIEVRIDLPLDGAPDDLGVLQVVHTVWEVEGERVPVTVDVRTEGELDPVIVRSSDDLDVLAPVQVAAPLDGQEVSGAFTASGMASSFEATVPWRFEDDRGRVVLEGFATAEGWMDRLYPWETEVDVSSLAPGTYTFIASTAEPSGGEGPGPTTDTRVVYVR